MPLTRHLYKEDEVAASLMFCCLRGRVLDAAFWCLELLDSGLADELILALRRIWLAGFGVSCLGWMVAFEEAVQEEAIDAERVLNLVVELARLGAARRHDCTGLVLLARTWKGGAAEQPDRVNAGPAGTGALTPLEFLRAALAQRKVETAWITLLALTTGGSDTSWKEVLAAATAGAAASAPWFQALCAMDDCEEMLRAAVAVTALACQATVTEPHTVRPLPLEVAQAVEQWRTNHGRRARRVCAIHTDAIPWLTERGRRLTVYESNEKELFRMERPTGLWGSQAWDDLAEEVGGWAAVRSDDDAREEFYERFFPDDIPDEWSRAERAKSHGTGVLQRGAAPSLARWLRLWFRGHPSAGVWEGWKRAVAWVEAAEGEGRGPVDVAGGWSGSGWAPTVEGWNMCPVQRRVVVSVS